MHTKTKLLLTSVLFGTLITWSLDGSVFAQSDFFELTKLGGEFGDFPPTRQSVGPNGQSGWTANPFEGIRLAQTSEASRPNGATGASAADSLAETSDGSAEGSDDEEPPFAEPEFGAFLSVNTFTFNHPWAYGVAEFPVQGRANIAENNSPLPQDRFFFFSNQFNNALNDSIAGIGAGGLNQRGRSLGRYTVVAEKTFFNKMMSVELRLPNYGSANSVDAGFTANTARVGNLRVITKFVLYRTEFLALVAGLGLTAPTGDDTQFNVADQVYTVENQAVHLLPYLAYLSNPTERFFYQGFFQLDTPTNGNKISYRDLASPCGMSLGRLNDQTLSYVDLSMGYWLYRNRLSPFLTKVAAMLELHYAGTLQDTDRVYGDVWDTNGLTTVEFSDGRNQFNVVNATFGVHTEFRNRIALRIGGVLPISNGDDRFFDSEIHTSVIYRY